MLRWRDPLLALALAFAASPAPASELAVTVTNASKSTQCAESDNVYLKLQSPSVRRFVVEATHPTYIGTLPAERKDPDFRHCDMSHDPTFTFAPRQITLYEDAEWRVIGYTFASFWRPERVPVRAGDRTETGLHLVQLWKLSGASAYEVLVVYPSDGYWRARPLAPPQLAEAAYGSSFLLGPIETQRRPLVRLREIVFDPPHHLVRVNFARGGSATLHLDTLDRQRLSLAVSLHDPIADGPFAALRSMYVTDTNADVARVAWRAREGKAWQRRSIMGFRDARAIEFWAGRVIPSRHNAGAPDMTFRGFADGARIRPPRP